MNRLLALFPAVIIVTGTALPAAASPGVSFACFDREFSARIDLAEDWLSARMVNNWGTFDLAASEGQGGPDNSFSFEDSTYIFRGIAPEGRIMRGDVVVAQCWQTARSQKAIALYGGDASGRWSSYEAAGQGFQTVRATPSVFGEKLASLDAGSAVTILENTDQFLDGYFWFRIRYGDGLFGYIWGALLCTNANEPELNAVVRSCR